MRDRRAVMLQYTMHILTVLIRHNDGCSPQTQVLSVGGAEICCFKLPFNYLCKMLRDR